MHNRCGGEVREILWPPTAEAYLSVLLSFATPPPVLLRRFALPQSLMRRGSTLYVASSFAAALVQRRSPMRYQRQQRGALHTALDDIACAELKRERPLRIKARMVTGKRRGSDGIIVHFQRHGQGVSLPEVGSAIQCDILASTLTSSRVDAQRPLQEARGRTERVAGLDVERPRQEPIAMRECHRCPVDRERSVT